MMKNFYQLFIIFVIGIASIDAQNADFTCKTFDTITSDIPDNVIKTVAVDQDENLWFATGDCFFGGSLVKYDGKKFFIYDSTNLSFRSEFVES